MAYTYSLSPAHPVAATPQRQAWRAAEVSQPIPARLRKDWRGQKSALAAEPKALDQSAVAFIVLAHQVGQQFATTSD